MVDPAAEHAQIERPAGVAPRRDHAAVDDRARAAPRRSRRRAENLVPATIELARAGGTVGEWAARCARCSASTAPRPVSEPWPPRPSASLSTVRERVQAAARELGRTDPPARRQARTRRSLERRRADRGRGPRRRHGGRVPGDPADARREIAAAARDEDVDVVGLSILSGSHLELVPETIASCAASRGRRARRGRRHHPRRRPATGCSWPVSRACTRRRTTASRRSSRTSPSSGSRTGAARRPPRQAPE